LSSFFVNLLVALYENSMGFSRAFIILLFLIAGSFSYGQPGDLTSKRIRFEQFPDDLNLSQNTINCVVQDHNGFLWIATWSGLIRYNGYNTTVFHAGSQAGNLKSNQISTLYEDGDNNLWVGTIKGGLYLYRQNQKGFTQFASSDKPKSLLNDNVRAIQKDKDGNLWVGTEGGLSVLAKGDSTFHTFKFSSDTTHFVPDNFITDLFVSSSGTLWIGTGRGVYELLPGNSLQESKFKQYTYDRDKEESAHQNWVIQITEFKYQGTSTLWFVTSKGLKKINNGVVENFMPSTNVARAGVFLTLLPGEYDKPYLLVGSDNGLFFFDPINNTFRDFLRNDDPELNLSNNSITALCLDRGGVLWVGTKKGLNKFDTYLNDFNGISTTTFDPSGSIVTGIQPSSDGGYWISTSGGGLFRFRNQKFEHFEFYKAAQSQFVSNIQTIFRDSQARIWLAAGGAGVFCFKDDVPKGGLIREYTHFDNQTKQKISSNYVMSFTEDKNKNIWVGTWADGLNRISPENKAELVDVDLKNKPIVAMLVDHLGVLWLGTKGNGLYSIDPNDPSKNSLKHFQNDNQEQGLTDHLINSLYEDDNGKLWIGTENGLKVFERHSGTFGHMPVPGIDNNVVVSFLPDAQGRFWIANWDGLHVVDPAIPNEVKHYDRHDEVKGGFFYNNVCLKDRSGNLLFGGSEGFNLINPSKLVQSPATPAVYIEKLSIAHQEIEPELEYNGEIILPKTINDVGKVKLNHLQNSISFDFAALDFASPEKMRYAYMLEGFDKDWSVTPSSRRFATYSNLNPGSYTFRVKASNIDGRWSETITSVEIQISSPWWETIWAKISYGILIVGVLYLLARFLLFRANVLHDLKLERIQRENMESLNQAKLQFFTNISHEFRTPLTLILGPLQTMLSEVSIGSKFHHQVRIANENAQRLLRLINQLLDFRKVETENMKLSVSEGNIVQLIHEIVQSFEPMAENCKVSLSTEARENISLWFDRDKCEKIFFNLISNAFKHTSAGGKITISVEELEDGVTIAVWDNGHGIKKAHIDNIFQSFFSFDEGKGYASTGIGLALVKGLVELHHGSIRVDSEENSFSRFSVTFKKGKAHFCEDELEVSKTSAAEQKHGANEIPEHADVSHADKQMKLLVVDDNEEMRAYVGSVFDSPFHIIHAVDGKEGLALAKDLIPDVIIADIMMPKLNGIDMCKDLKRDLKTSHIPVVLLTARGSTEFKVEGLESGADEYVTKPFNPKVLQLKVKNLINRRNVLHEYFRGQAILNLEPSRVTLSSADDQFIKNALELVELNMSNASYTVEEMSHDIGMSHTQFYRKIKALTGQTINDFIRAIRLKRAAQLLEQHQLTVSEITYKVGFTDLQHFRECFKKMYGITPSQYAQKSGRD
jgi:signal transduction histidine kinase/ligand-binding sensor domain-containing protein/DNA-binding response OmpR family regulator